MQGASQVLSWREPWILARHQLSGEAQAAGDATHGRRDQMVQVSVGGCRKLQSAKADVIQGLKVERGGREGYFTRTYDITLPAVIVIEL